MQPSTQNTGELTLYAILLGCKPKGRNVEQHDVLFGVANSIEGLTADMKTFWYKPLVSELGKALKKELPGADTADIEERLLSTLARRDKVHIDAWLCVEYVDGYKVVIREKASLHGENGLKLYFINLGGYLENEFEEFHKKLFVVAPAVSEALAKVKNHDFMKSYSPESLGRAGSAHLDDQYKIDFEADDIVCISETIGNGYVLTLEAADEQLENKMVVGYKQLNYNE